jgi:hypothetical protein
LLQALQQGGVGERFIAAEGDALVGCCPRHSGRSVRQMEGRRCQLAARQCPNGSTVFHRSKQTVWLSSNPATIQLSSTRWRWSAKRLS